LTIPLTDLGYQHLKILDPLAELRRKQTFKKNRTKKRRTKEERTTATQLFPPISTTPE